MEYLFRKGTTEDAEGMLALIKKRIDWMNAVGIDQWNNTHYLERYPLDYYQNKAEAGQLYVLTDVRERKIVAGAILYDCDSRWDSMRGILKGSAFYVHNLVSDTDAKGAGLAMMHAIRELAEKEGLDYLRLDSQVGNSHLEEWYRRLGFVEVGRCTDGVYHGILREAKI